MKISPVKRREWVNLYYDGRSQSENAMLRARNSARLLPISSALERKVRRRGLEKDQNFNH